MVNVNKKVQALIATLGPNMRYFMEQEGCEYRTANALGLAVGMSPNTIRYYIDPDKRPKYATTKKTMSAPSLDKLVLIADKLHCEVWELLHPDIERVRRDAARLQRIDEEYRKAQVVDGVPSSATDLQGITTRSKGGKRRA